MITRRGVLAGGISAAASAAYGQAPLSSLVPMPRPTAPTPAGAAGLENLIAASPYQGAVAAVVADARTGEILQGHNASANLPPASTMKVLTTLYALDALGAGYRFATRVLATGNLRNGRLEGDLWLYGEGDPHLDTTGLATLVTGLRDIGLREVTGALHLVDTSLPSIPLIDATQADYAGYNPAISGLNLNFNRVYLAWEQGTNGLQVGLDARADDLRPAVLGIGLTVADRAAPILDYRAETATAREGWSVARSALTGEGGRWLPVRNTAAYVGEVFASLARSSGIVLSRVQRATAVPSEAAVLSEISSAPLDGMLRSMLRYSTNLTAEVVGLRATQTLTGAANPSLRQSADHMAARLEGRYVSGRAELHDHSGLQDLSQMTPVQMVQALVAAGPRGRLRNLLRAHRVNDEVQAQIGTAEIVTKTGTLNFVSTLTGYIEGPNRPLAFAIFNADLPRRAALGPQERDRPPGGRTWIGRARTLQNDMLVSWLRGFG